MKTPTPVKLKFKRFTRKKFCKFCADKSDFIDYKDVQTLRAFITQRGKILPSRMSGACAKHQRALSNAIQRARNIALLSFTER